MDIVIPLATGIGENLELKYALRSIDKNLSGYNRIFIVSDVLPSWAQGVQLIKAKDNHLHNKDANIIDKVKKACTEIKDLSDVFLFWSDDQALLKPCKCSEITPVYSTLTPDLTEDSTWRRRLRNTIEYLTKQNKSGTHWDSHVPQPYSKKLFIQVMDQVPYQTEPGFAINTLFFNYIGEKPIVQKDTVKCTVEEKVDDLKFHEQVESARWIGYNDTGWKQCVKTFFERVFTKSKYEKEKTEMELLKMKEHTVMSMKKLHSVLRKPYMVVGLMDSILSYLPQLEPQYNLILHKIKKLPVEQRNDKTKLNLLCAKIYAETRTTLWKVITTN